jgi:parallel beta-helix repeat protein
LHGICVFIYGNVRYKKNISEYTKQTLGKEDKNMVNRKILLLLCIVFLSLSVTNQFCARASPATIRVPEDYSTIQAAIDHANPGNTIQVSSGTYHENLFINKTLTLIGEDKVNTIIVGNGHGISVIQVNLTTVNISGFTLTNGTNGIMLETCNGSIIRDNNVENYLSRGIWLYHSYSNTVSDNFISNSSWRGIVLCGHSSENIIVRNTIKDNANGIVLTGWNNLIYHNNFINNQNQTVMLESFNNTWNNSLEGNYWSNYEGKDANQDGIGDTPYTIDANNQDNYPLMGTVTQFQVSKDGKTYYVTTISNSTITDLNFGNSMSIDVTGPEGTVGFCRITLPRALFDGDPAILVNGAPPITEKELPASNSTHVYLYFVYAHIPLQAVMTPESLAIIIISILTISTVAAIIVAKKGRSKKKETK